MPVACGERIRSACSNFFVCFKLIVFFCSEENLFSYIYKIIYLFYSPMSSQPTGVVYEFLHVVN